MDLETLLNRHIELRRSYLLCDARKTAVLDYWGWKGIFTSNSSDRETR